MSSSNQSVPPATPWDPGLQNERTALAWIRSSLALLGAALIVVRVAATTTPALAVILAVASLLLAGYSLASAAHRYRRVNRLLGTGTPLPDGQLPAVLATYTAVIGGGALTFVLLH
jgi:uncharacterized membrane protein YidH (DUF202 family)